MKVAIEDLTPFPDNPRRGNVGAIAESLVVNGQYKPIIVRRSDNVILAGNHTWEAARNLGWADIDVVYVEPRHDAHARRIVAVDNRAAERGAYNFDQLTSLLTELPSLDGTGYTADDLRRFASSLNASDEVRASLLADPGSFEGVNGSPSPSEEATAKIIVGSHSWDLDAGRFRRWAVRMGRLSDPENEIRARLATPEHALPVPPLKPRKAPVERIARDEAERHLVLDATSVPTADLSPHAQNPRRGKIDIIAESLEVNGQYRPILVNRPTMTIIAGHHTWQAAKSLGWESVQCVFVEGDEDAARRMLLADNRIADLGHTDEAALAEFLPHTADELMGTGYDRRDIERLMGRVNEFEADQELRAAELPARIRVKHVALGVHWQILVEHHAYEAWHEDLVRSSRYSEEAIEAEVLRRLGVAKK